MRKIFMFAILFLLAGCTQNTAEYEIEALLPFVQNAQEYLQSILDEPQQTHELYPRTESYTDDLLLPVPPNFHILPSGTRADTRLDAEVVDLILRHFNAIESGDISAFRETLQAQDGASINWNTELILDSFWDIVVGNYQYEMFPYGSWGAGRTELGSYRLFAKEFASVSRNTGLFVREIRLSDYSHYILAATTNNIGEKRFYRMGLLNDYFYRPGIEWRWPTEEWEIDALNIRDLWQVDDDFLSQFENIHTAEYLQWETEFPATLIIWPNEPLRDFSFVSVHSNAICCAYVGRSILTVDELQPSDAVVLTLALMGYIHPACGVIFTDTNGERHYKIFFQEISDLGDGQVFHLSDFSNLISRRKDWVCLEIITLPASFSHDKGGRWNDVVANTNCPLVPSHEVFGEPSQIWAGYLKVESIESMLERSLNATEFIFDDGHIGYMLDSENDIWWVRHDWMAMSFLHGGYRAFFEIHEDLILQIARTLRMRGS